MKARLPALMFFARPFSMTLQAPLLTLNSRAKWLNQSRGPLQRAAIK